MLLPLQKGIVYGPVASRRLGASLGVNLLPRSEKVCTFDCAYCQYGWTRTSDPAGVELPEASGVLAAVERALGSLAHPPDYITFSGQGEATLHPEFAALVEGVRELRDRLASPSRTAILSNSGTVGDAAVRAALSRLDVRIMKLDAGTEAVLHRFNRPVSGITLAGILDGLRRLRDVTIQALFTAGEGGNSNPADIDAWVEAVVSIEPVAVQVYTLDRGYPSRDIAPLPAADLERIAGRLIARGLKVRAY